MEAANLKDSLLEKFGSLQTEFELLNQQRQIAIEQRDFLQKSYSELEGDYLELRQAYDDDRVHFATAKKELMEITEERKHLEIRLAEILQEMETLYNERSVLMKLCDGQKARFEKFKRRMRHIWRGVGILKNNSIQNQRRSVRLEQMVSELKIENEALRVSLSSHQAALEEMKSKTSQMTVSEHEQLQAAKSLREEYERISDDLVRARRQLTETEVRLARSEATAREEIGKLQAELREKQDLFETRVAEATESTRLERQTLKAQVADLNAKIRNLETSEESLRYDLNKIEKEHQGRLETLKQEHDRLIENLRFEYDSKIKKMVSDHEANTYILINERQKAIDEAVAENRQTISMMEERINELRSFSERQIDENQRLINEKATLSQGVQITHQLEREVIKLREENQGLSQSFSSLQALWDNSINQREESAEREARYKAANDELMNALTIAQKSAEELRERLKAERRENAQVIADLTAELEDLRREVQVNRGMRSARELTQAMAQKAEAQPMPPVAMKDRQVWEEFYNRWEKRIAQLAAGTEVGLDPQAPLDLSGFKIPEPPTQASVQKLHDQLISERGDLQSFD